jgi:hypothetical protein
VSKERPDEEIHGFVPGLRGRVREDDEKQHLGKTKRVDQAGASNSKNEIGGYSIVQAESHDAAAKIFGKDHPHLHMPGAWIEIVEIMPLPGM